MDFVFKKIFGEKGSENILKDFLNSILEEKIESIEISKDVHLEKTVIDNKEGILDVQAKLDNNRIINIEIQVNNKYNMVERSLYYWSGIYYNSLRRGQNYKENSKVIMVNILDYAQFKEGPYHEIVRLRRDYEGKVLTPMMEMHYIQIPKCKDEQTDLGMWMQFIGSISEEGVMKAMEKKKEIKEANDKLEYLTGDEELQRLAIIKDLAEKDYNTRMYYDKKKAREEGLAEGKAEGKAEEKIKIAKKMLKEKIDITIISKIVGISEDEINNIKNEI